MPPTPPLPPAKQTSSFLKFSGRSGKATSQMSSASTSAWEFLPKPYGPRPQQAMLESPRGETKTASSPLCLSHKEKFQLRMSIYVLATRKISNKKICQKIFLFGSKTSDYWSHDFESHIDIANLLEVPAIAKIVTRMKHLGGSNKHNVNL